MPAIDLIPARAFFASRIPLPSLVYVGGSHEASVAGRRLGVPENQVIAAYNCSIKGLYLSGAAFTLHELRISNDLLAPHEARIESRETAFLTVALEDIAEVRQGFEVAEIVLRGNERLRLRGDLNPFLRLCIECLRETTGSPRAKIHLGQIADGV